MSDVNAAENPIHASGLVIGTKGILVRGPSGSGKSRLCQLLVEACEEKSAFGRWVADDRVSLAQASNRVLMTCLDPISGLAERRFHGIYAVSFQREALVDLVVDLVDLENLERLPEHETINLLASTTPIPHISVPKNNIVMAKELVLTALDQRIS